TPEGSVMQCGFSARTHKSVGIHDDTYASVVLMQANETIAIIALDVCLGDRSFTDSLKETLNEKHGLTPEKIIINYSHTHAAVALRSENKDGTTDQEGLKYCNSVIDKVVNLVDEGLNNLSTGDLYIFKGKSKFGVSRRFPSDEGILWRPYFDDNSIDTDLFLLKFVDSKGHLKGLIYNYACHPTTLGSDNYLISADYPGVVRKALEEWNNGMTAVFLQGCGADVKPSATADDGRFKSCNFDELEKAGISLADEIKKCLQSQNWRKIEADFSATATEVKLYSEIWDDEKWNAMLNDPNEAEYRKRAIERILEGKKENKIKNYFPYYISVLRLDDKTCIAALENEVVSDYGKAIKGLFQEDVITLGYSNSIVCYIPTKKVLIEGGYERETFLNAEIAGVFVPEIEDIIIGRTSLMINNKG
ncbi:MAG: neutral/alkaline non-lysosomal ceramidase N-terminal domain-containing protein, partial [Ruminiclostridium sp.]|nr:neutral/alkaline non-lysosomal ceramidase N-terminal domain-containing protein [Ruminiclostridium sp.]